MPGGTDKKDNVYPLKKGDSLDHLVRHMRQVRDSIPVNHRLRRELRAKLAEGRQGAPESAAVFPVQAGPGKKTGTRRWAAGLILAFILLAAVLVIIWRPVEKVLEAGPVAELARFWAQDTPLVPAVSPLDGTMVVERGGALLLLNREGALLATVRPPAGRRYFSPAWSSDGRKLALVRDGGAGSEVVVLEIPANTAPKDMQRVIQQGLEQAAVLSGRPAGCLFTGLSWSPDGEALAGTLFENGQSSVVLIKGNKEVDLGPGARPAWSPDGKWLVVERDGRDDKTLWLVGTDGAGSYPLGPGRFPVWNREGYLLFMKTGIQEKILSFLPDGSPQFTVQRKTGEIRWLRPGRGEGSERTLQSPEGGLATARLLTVLDSPAGTEEMQWLKSLELNGVREPRTLFLDRAGDYEGLYSGDGRSLLVVRRDGGTVLLSRISLVEKVAKGEGSER